MKKIKFLATLLAAGALVACNETIEPQGSGENTPTTGEGYVKVAINMPTTSGDMTNADPSFDDGLESEYKVNNGIIVFFKYATGAATPDETAKFNSVYSLGSLGQQDQANDGQVSTVVSTIMEAPYVDNTTNSLYALVILNYNEKVIEINASNRALLSINGEALNSESTLADFRKKLANQDLANYTGVENAWQFTMCNAPLADSQKNDETLSKVTVYETRAAAEGATADEIYVERVVAKVTLTTNSGNKSIEVNGGQDNVYNGDEVGLLGWTLNITNKSTKLVRDVSLIEKWYNTNNSDFIGTSPVKDNYFRTYWAIDGNYDGKNYDKEFNVYVSANGGNNDTIELPEIGSDSDDVWNTEIGSEKPLYCFENTMNYDQQHKDQTTGVIIKANYKAQIGNETGPTEGDFFICGTDPTAYRATTQQGESPAIGIIETIEDLFPPQTVDIVLQDVSGGRYDNTNLGTLFKKKVGDTQEGLSPEEISTIWNALGTINYYKNGDSYYYSTLIRHFQSTIVYWDPSNPQYTEKHLGRYGVVRKNWYEININSISGPGDPSVDVPDPEDPDDETEGYINCTINVLSWAKRSQDVDL